MAKDRYPPRARKAQRERGRRQATEDALSGHPDRRKTGGTKAWPPAVAKGYGDAMDSQPQRRKGGR